MAKQMNKHNVYITYKKKHNVHIVLIKWHNWDLLDYDLLKMYINNNGVNCVINTLA